MRADDGGYPESGTVVDLIPASSGETFLCWTEIVEDGRLVVTAPSDRAQHPVQISIGERVDVVWRSAAGLRSLPCELVAVDRGERPRWELRPGGVVQRGQRRDAVRAPLSVPVTLGPESAPVSGTTVDLSEGGLRCVLEAGAAPEWLPPAPERPTGTVVPVALRLPDLSIQCLGELTHRFPRQDARVELSVRLIGLSEHEQDDLRRRIFDRLRDLRRRGLI